MGWYWGGQKSVVDYDGMTNSGRVVIAAASGFRFRLTGDNRPEHIIHKMLMNGKFTVLPAVVSHFGQGMFDGRPFPCKIAASATAMPHDRRLRRSGTAAAIMNQLAKWQRSRRIPAH
jgi:hypothetical protein